jgi:hypothetical protein
MIAADFIAKWRATDLTERAAAQSHLIESLRRYIVTPETSEHRLFVWLEYPIFPDKNLIVFPREG